MKHSLQKYAKSPIPGWLAALAGAAWEALEKYDKVGQILPFPPWLLFGVGIVWVILAKREAGDIVAKPQQSASEVVFYRERTTTIEREFVVRKEG